MKVLTKKELKAITGKGTNATIIAELNYMGIDHKVRSNGTALVFEEDLRAEYRPTPKKQVVLNLDHV